MTKLRKRFDHERKTILVMIEMYCRGKHKCRAGLCAECLELLAYSIEKIERCRYQYDKPECSRCPIHCYKPDLRKQIQKIMRYSGPRMMLHHPVLTVLHYIYGIAGKKQRKRYKV